MIFVGSFSFAPNSHNAFSFLLTVYSSQGQEAATNAGQMPQARGDFEALQRLAIEQIGATFGVPADLMFNGRFASKSTSQYVTLPPHP